MSDDHEEDEDYKVGFGRPPKDTQFKPGQSGNPRGRPKGSRNSGSFLQQELSTTIKVNEGGKTRALTKLEAIYLRAINGALAGNAKSYDLLRKIMGDELVSLEDDWDYDGTTASDRLAEELVKVIRERRKSWEEEREMMLERGVYEGMIGLILGPGPAKRKQLWLGTYDHLMSVGYSEQEAEDLLNRSRLAPPLAWDEEDED